MAVGPSTRIRGSEGTNQTKWHPLNSMWFDCLQAMIDLVDYAVVRMDDRLTRSQQDQIRALVNGKGEAFTGKLIADISANDWRDEMLRRLDDIKPDLVLTPDCDEMFGPGIEQDLKRLWDSDACGLMFSFVMAPSGTRVYPNRRQMKVFKWESGLVYNGGTFCVPGSLKCNKRHPKMQARTNIIHHAFIDEPFAAPQAVQTSGSVTLSVSISGKSVSECLRELGQSMKKFGK